MRIESQFAEEMMLYLPQGTLLWQELSGKRWEGIAAGQSDPRTQQTGHSLLQKAVSSYTGPPRSQGLLYYPSCLL